MTDNRDGILSYMNEFAKKYGYTPTAYQIAEEFCLPYDKASFIVENLRAEGKIRIYRPLI